MALRSETEYFFLLAKNIELLAPEAYRRLTAVVEIQRMLNTFISTLQLPLSSPIGTLGSRRQVAGFS